MNSSTAYCHMGLKKLLQGNLETITVAGILWYPKFKNQLKKKIIVFYRTPSGKSGENVIFLFLNWLNQISVQVKLQVMINEL